MMTAGIGWRFRVERRADFGSSVARTDRPPPSALCSDTLPSAVLPSAPHASLTPTAADDASATSARAVERPSARVATLAFVALPRLGRDASRGVAPGRAPDGFVVVRAPHARALRRVARVAGLVASTPPVAPIPFVTTPSPSSSARRARASARSRFAASLRRPRRVRARRPTPSPRRPHPRRPHPPLVNRVLAVEARTPEDVLRVVDRHGASFDPVNVATALRALHRACVRVAANGTGVDGTRRVRYAKNRRLDPVALGAKVDADPRTTTLARLALHHVDAFEPRDLAGVVRALANLHADFRVLVADTAPAASGVFATSANPANTSSLYPRLASALSTSARGFDARHCASTLGALAKLRKAHRRAFDVFDANAWRAAFVATERETVRVDARGAAEMCRALGGVGANIRATFVTASFANALALGLTNRGGHGRAKRRRDDARATKVKR